jgi:hypothetical protein
MKPTAIIVTNYMGRPVNPHWNAPVDPDDEENIYDAVSSLRWRKFEEAVQSYPCPSLANTEPGKTILAELRWQMYDDNDGYEEWTYSNCPERDRANGYITRQIWVPIVEQKEGEGNEPPIIQRLDKVEQTVSELILLVSELAIAIRKIFETQ